jgi:hypothetical protein
LLKNCEYELSFILKKQINREYKRMNDECADKIADNRYSIANSREWLVDQGGISDRVHLMSAKTVIIFILKIFYL